MDEVRFNKISIWRALHGSWVDFMTHTSMHGLKYICEDGRKLIERIFWILIVTFQIVSTVFMVSGIYKRYSSNQTTSNIERTHYPTWFLPFPGVTICNSNRILRSKAEALVNQLVLPENVPKEEILEDLRYLGDLHEPEFPANERTDRLQNILDDNRYTISNLMLQFSQTCEQMFEKCSWQGDIVKCSDLFEIRKSHLGYCCSFNHFGVKDSRSRGHSKVLWRVEGESTHTPLYGPNMGLSILVNPMLHEYFLTSHFARGIKVIIHHPEEYPDKTAVTKMVPIGTEALLPITISALYSESNVRNLHPSVRKCVFEDEHPLNFFPEYRHLSCIVECEMHYTLELCGCIPYYYPDNGQYSICDLAHIDCLYRRFGTFQTKKIVGYGTFRNHLETVNETEDNWDERTDNMECDCPKQCDQVSYQVDLSIGDFKAGAFTINPFYFEDANVTERVLLHIYLETNFAELSKRSVATTFADLLSMIRIFGQKTKDGFWLVTGCCQLNIAIRDALKNSSSIKLKNYSKVLTIVTFVVGKMNKVVALTKNANLGGVVCLFLGCSFVTLVEIVYFFTIRLQRKKDRHNISKRPELECPYTPKDVREARYPSIKQTLSRTIRVLPQKVIPY